MFKLNALVLFGIITLAQSTWSSENVFFRISSQANYAQSTMREAQTEFSVPISLGYHASGISFGFDYFRQTSPREGNETLMVFNQTDLYSLFFEYDLYQYSKIKTLAGASAGLGRSLTETNLLGSITQNTSNYMSYTNIYASFYFAINSVVSVGVSTLLQNSALLNPSWQLGLRSTLQLEF